MSLRRFGWTMLCVFQALNICVLALVGYAMLELGVGLQKIGIVSPLLGTHEPEETALAEDHLFELPVVLASLGDVNVGAAIKFRALVDVRGESGRRARLAKGEFNNEIKDSLIRLAATTSRDELARPEGIEAFKASIGQIVARSVFPTEAGQVNRVLLSEFIVQ